jgi:hypothetical protein
MMTKKSLILDINSNSLILDVNSSSLILDINHGSHTCRSRLAMSINYSSRQIQDINSSSLI